MMCHKIRRQFCLARELFAVGIWMRQLLLMAVSQSGSEVAAWGVVIRLSIRSRPLLGKSQGPRSSYRQHPRILIPRRIRLDYLDSEPEALAPAPIKSNDYPIILVLWVQKRSSCRVVKPCSPPGCRAGRWDVSNRRLINDNYN
jgi:hypothetical protein